MGLQKKWFLWHAAAGVYVLLLAGIFYHNSSKRETDSRLKKEVLDLAREHSLTLIKGLVQKPGSITMDEYDVFTRVVDKDPSVLSVVYLDAGGRVRWHKDARLIGRHIGDLAEEVSLPTDVVAAARDSMQPQIRAVRDGSLYEAAVPLGDRGALAGLLEMQVSRQGASEEYRRGMARFIGCGMAALVAVGLLLYYFFKRHVLDPLHRVQGDLERLSFGDLRLSGKRETGEFGSLAAAMDVFLEKVRGGLDGIRAAEAGRQEAESSWWEAVLAAALPSGCSSMVLDENNTVLHSSLPSQRGAHLLDVVQTGAQDLLRLIGRAMEGPGRAVEGEVSTGEAAWRVRALNVDSGAGMGRTVVLLFPKSGAA